MVVREGGGGPQSLRRPSHSRSLVRRKNQWTSNIQRKDLFYSKRMGRRNQKTPQGVSSSPGWELRTVQRVRALHVSLPASTQELTSLRSKIESRPHQSSWPRDNISQIHFTASKISRDYIPNLDPYHSFYINPVSNPQTRQQHFPKILSTLFPKSSPTFSQNPLHHFTKILKHRHHQNTPYPPHYTNHKFHKISGSLNVIFIQTLPTP